MSGRPIVTDAMRDAARALNTVPHLVADVFGVKPEWVERLLAGRGSGAGRANRSANALRGTTAKALAVAVSCVWNRERNKLMNRARRREAAK